MQFCYEEVWAADRWDRARTAEKNSKKFLVWRGLLKMEGERALWRRDQWRDVALTPEGDGRCEQLQPSPGPMKVPRKRGRWM